MYRSNSIFKCFSTAFNSKKVLFLQPHSDWQVMNMCFAHMVTPLSYYYPNPFITTILLCLHEPISTSIEVFLCSKDFPSKENNQWSLNQDSKSPKARMISLPQLTFGQPETHQALYSFLEKLIASSSSQPISKVSLTIF